MAVDPDYMKVLQQFTELCKMPKSESKSKAEHVLALIEEYHEDHPRLAGHQMRTLDRMENSCRERLNMPLLKRSFFEKVVQRLS